MNTTPELKPPEPEQQLDALKTPSKPAKPVILITGVSGLIGTRIVSRFAGEATLVGLDVKPPTDMGADGDFLETDLTDEASVHRSLSTVCKKYGHDIASVIHLAAHYDFSGQPSPLYEELTVKGTRRLVRELHRQNFLVEQFVFASSLLVMEPDPKGRRVSEFSNTRAEWAYPQSKLDAEEVIHKEHGLIPTVILRIAGVYDEQCHSLPLSQQIARIYERQFESYVFPGDPSHGQALVHLDDLADCFHKAVSHRRQLGNEHVFLIAEPDVMTYQELQEQLGHLIHGKEWPTIRIPKIMAKAGAWIQEKLAGDEQQKPFIKPWMIDLADDYYAAMISHARSKLQWEPEHRLRDTIFDMIAFLKNNPQEFYHVNGLPLPENMQAESVNQ